MKCNGCNKTLEVGDQYIEDTASGYLNDEPDAEFDSLVSEILGGTDGKIFYCSDCTTPGGDYILQTVLDDED